MAKQKADDQPKLFAVMRWLNDGQRLSVHNLDQVVEPKKPIHTFKPADTGLALYHGYPGLWNFRILAVGGQKEMKSWLDEKFQMLREDVTDRFCEGISTENQSPTFRFSPTFPGMSTPKKRKTEVAIIDSTAVPVIKSVVPVVTLRDSPAPGKSGTTRKSSTPRKLVTPKKLNSPGKSGTTGKSTTPRKSVTPRMSPAPGKSTTPRKSRTPAKSPGASSAKDYYKYLKSHSTSTSSGSKIRSLEREVRCLKERVSKLEGLHIAEPRMEQYLEKTASPKQSISSPKKTVSTISIKSPDEADINVDTSNIHGDLNIFKYLSLRVFTEEDLRTRSRTGKRTIKNMDNARPPLDSSKMAHLECLVKQHIPHYDKDTFHKKIENLQMVLRRK